MKIEILVSAPCGGKTFYAKQLEEQGYTRISQDDLGRSEHILAFEEALSQSKPIVIDRMNMNKEQRKRYLEPAMKAGYTTKIKVLCTPRVICEQRHKLRVDHPTIMNDEHYAQATNIFFKLYERPEETEANEVEFVYNQALYTPYGAYVCDLDNSLCNIDHRLHYIHPKDGQKKNWNAFADAIDKDTLNEDIAEIIKRLGHKQLIFCSGRHDDYAEKTRKWLTENGFEYHELFKELFMRPRNCYKPDFEVKEAILDFELIPRFGKNIVFFDDRDQVVRKYRERGYRVLQVAEGSF